MHSFTYLALEDYVQSFTWFAYFDYELTYPCNVQVGSPPILKRKFTIKYRVQINESTQSIRKMEEKQRNVFGGTLPSAGEDEPKCLS